MSKPNDLNLLGLKYCIIVIDKFREENNEKLSQRLRPTAPDNRPVILGASDN